MTERDGSRELTVRELQDRGFLLVEDGNHGEYRPRPDEFADEGIAFIRAADMDGGRVLFNRASKINAVARSRIRKGIGAPGDVLLSHKGTVGKVALVPLEAPPFVCSPQTTFWRSLDEDELDRRFLFAYLKSTVFQNQLAAFKGETDMADYVSLTTQRGLKVPVPPIHIQRAIAAVLGALDDKIDLNRRMNETQEAMARALFKSWFVDFDPVRAKAGGLMPADMDEATAELFPNVFVEANDDRVPAGWTAVALGALVHSAGGHVQTGPFGSQLHAEDYVADGVPVIMPTNIAGRSVDPDGAARISEANADRLGRHRLRVGDLVYSRRGDVEKHALISEDEEGWICGTGCLMIRPGPGGVSAVFLSLQLDQPHIRAWIAARAIGATMPNLNTGILSEVPLVVPSAEVQSAFAQLAEPLESLKRQNRRENATLSELRDLLLPKLLSGELRVRDADRIVERAV
jgi:type I restriction enzyme, S subunit